MYSIFFTFALCLVASARPAFKNRQFLNDEIPGVATGISCTTGDPDSCFNGAVASCTNGQLVVSQACAAPTTCLQLPVNNSTTDFAVSCSTTDIQTDLFAQAFGGIENIPTDD
ncbi:hypothetical protein DFH06DRAFT_1468450 [Mycena polygramma]|nr:hypothetical protein DFH06DRAFT_1468450 [Mycena polygramma]